MGLIDGPTVVDAYPVSGLVHYLHIVRMMSNVEVHNEDIGYFGAMTNLGIG